MGLLDFMLVLLATIPQKIRNSCTGETFRPSPLASKPATMGSQGTKGMGNKEVGKGYSSAASKKKKKRKNERKKEKGNYICLVLVLT